MGTHYKFSIQRWQSFFNQFCNVSKSVSCELLIGSKWIKLMLFYLPVALVDVHYVFEFLRQIILRRCTSRKPAFLVPTQYNLVVSRGGVHYCRQPEIIVARKRDASYGLGVSTFLEGIHRIDYAYYDDDWTKKILCGLTFCGKGSKL